MVGERKYWKIHLTPKQYKQSVCNGLVSHPEISASVISPSELELSNEERVKLTQLLKLNNRSLEKYVQTDEIEINLR